MIHRQIDFINRIFISNTKIQVHTYTVNSLAFEQVKSNPLLTDSLRAIIMQMRNDIDKLTKSIENQGSERLHVIMIKQKDTEISRMNNTIGELQQANQNLEKQVKDQESLIVSLRECTDATGELQQANQSLEKQVEVQKSIVALLRNEIDAKNKINETFKSDLTASLESNAQLKNEVDNLGRKLAEAEKVEFLENTNSELFRKNELLEQEVTLLKMRLAQHCNLEAATQPCKNEVCFF